MSIRRSHGIRGARTLAVLLAIIMCLPIAALGRTVEEFEDGQQAVTVDLAEAGTMDDALQVPWNYTAEALVATMNITPGPHTAGGKDYPTSPSINIGGQDGPEWAFNGTGYGSYGHQTMFSDGNTSFELNITGAEETTKAVLLPKGATIESASLKIKGETSDLRYVDTYPHQQPVNYVTYSTSLETMFYSGAFGLVLADENTGDTRLIDSWSVPKLPSATIYMLRYEEAIGVLFVSTGQGLHLFNYTTMDFIGTYSTTSKVHLISNYAKDIDYDPDTGLLAVINGQYCTVIDYLEQKNIGSYRVDTHWSHSAYSVLLDPPSDTLWVGATNGLHKVSLETFEQIKLYAPYTDPQLANYYIYDIDLDPVAGRLMLMEYTSGSNDAVEILDIDTDTIYASLDSSSSPSLPSTYVNRIQYDAPNDDLYIATRNGILVYDVGTKSEVKQYNTASSPALLDDYVNDISLVSGHMAVASEDGASLIDVVSGTTLLDSTGFSENPSFDSSNLRYHHTDVVNDRVIVAQYDSVSVLDLNTNTITRELSGDDLTDGHGCPAISNMLYDEDSGYLIVGCVYANDPQVGILELDTDTFVAYYDKTTTPALIPKTTSVLHYDSVTDQLFVLAYQGGLTIINLTTNATTVITGATSPLSLPDLTVTGLAYDHTRDVVFVSMNYYGIVMMNLSDNSQSELTDSTTPALGSLTSLSDMMYDDSQDRLFVSYYTGIDIIDMSPLSIAARYSGTTDPAIPHYSVYTFVLDEENDILYLGGYGGGAVLDLDANVSVREYTTSSNPSTQSDPIYTFDHYTDRDWDIALGSSWLQIFKPDSTLEDPELRIGGLLSWHAEGSFTDTLEITDLADEVQMALDDAPALAPDEFGNVLAKVPISFITQRAGLLTVDNLSIVYSHTATTPDLSGPLNDHIDATQDLNGTVPISVGSTSPGKLTFDQLHIDIDEAPFFDAFPEDLWIYENSISTDLLDLKDYIHDDLDPMEDLVIEVSVITNATHVKVGLFEDHMLFMDAFTKPASRNWTGTIELTVTATDTRGLSRTSDPISVRVEPVADVVITSEPVLEVLEDDPYLYQVTAVSHRNLSLSYGLDTSPTDMAINDTTGQISWAPCNDDVGVHAIEINVTDGTYSAIQVFDLTVLPVNDGPVLTGLDDLTAFEGAPLVIDMSDHVIDVDTDISNMTIIVRSSFATVDGPLVTFLYPEGSDMGSESVTFMVSDGEALASATIEITILGMFSISDIPDQQATEGTSMTLDLVPYIDDPQGKDLTVTTSSKYITVNGTKLTILYVVGCGLTEEKVTVSVTDGTASNVTNAIFKVKVTPVFPKVTMTEPGAGTKVSGKFTVSGTASISSGTITKVEVKVDDGDWVQATGTTSWALDLKAKDLKEGVHYIHVRAFSGNVSSEDAYVDIEVKHPDEPTISTAGWTATGLVIGLIIAAIIGVIAYVLGKGKRERPGPAKDDEEEEDDDEDEPPDREDPDDEEDDEEVE